MTYLELWAKAPRYSKLIAKPLSTASTLRQSVSFLVDTQAVVKSLENPRTDKSTMLKLKTTLNSVGKTREIVVKWIKGHVGHYGNEGADKKAKAGSGKTLTGSAPFFPVSRTTTIQAINRYTRDLR